MLADNVMAQNTYRTAIELAAERLRELVLAQEDGAMIGSEDALVDQLGCARGTVKQAARLLEREGLLKVRRGINGGYFGSRPDAETIESIVSAYLAMLNSDPEDITMIASILWVEVMRKAARKRTAEATVMAQKYLAKVRGLKAGASFNDVMRIEQESRKAIFDLVGSHYVELIFQINSAFANKAFPPTPHSEQDNTVEHREFLDAWRNAKVLEFQSILDGDPELAVMAARHARSVWHRRIWRHDPQN